MDIIRDCCGCRLHTTDGGVQQKFGLPWVAGDVVGCGIKLDGVAHSSVDKTRIQVFFTVNGQKVGRCVWFSHGRIGNIAHYFSG